MITPDRLDAARTRTTVNMTDTCTVVRPATGGGSMDPTTLQWTDTATQIYAGPCSIRSRPGPPQTGVEGEVHQDALVYDVALPFDSTVPQINDVVTVDTSTFTAQLVGASLRVKAAGMGSQQTALIAACDLLVRAR